LLGLAFVTLLSSTSFAQAKLTDDTSSYGPKTADLYLGNCGGSCATTFLKFSLSGVPAESNVSRASLKLFVNPNSPGNPNQGGLYQVDVRDIGNLWSEQSPGPQNNGTLLTTVSVSLSSYSNFIAIDVTDLVRDWINGIRPNNGVALGIRSGPRNYLVLDSKENTLASQSPKLELVLDKITGVMATAGLFGGGTTGNVAVGISDGGVTTANLADGAVTSPKIASGAVGTQQLGLSAVTSANIAAAAVGNQHLSDGAVTTSKIAPSAVTTPQLAAGAVTSTNIATGAVGDAQLANGAVNTTHLADNAVTSAKIASGQVVKSLNGLTDSLSLVAGNNITISSAGNSLTVSANTTTGASLKINAQQIALLRWYEANEASDNVVVGSGPRRVLFDGTYLWVSNYDDDSVSKVRPSDGELIATYPVGDTPWGMTFDGSNLWVVNSRPSKVTKLRARDGVVIGTFGPFGGDLVDAAFDGKNIWVTDNSLRVVRKFATDGTVLGTFTVDYFPFGVIFDGANIWVANSSNANLTKLRASDGALLGTFYTGGQDSNGLAFDGTNVWVSNFSSSDVTKIRASDGASLGRVPVGSGAGGVVFDGIYIWVGAYNSSTITKIRASDSEVIGTYTVSAGPTGMAFDGANIWVANQLTNTVSKR
jgi:hypothetical protein